MNQSSHSILQDEDEGDEEKQSEELLSTLATRRKRAKKEVNKCYSCIVCRLCTAIVCTAKVHYHKFHRNRGYNEVIRYKSYQYLPKIFTGFPDLIFWFYALSL